MHPKEYQQAACAMQTELYMNVTLIFNFPLKLKHYSHRWCLIFCTKYMCVCVCVCHHILSWIEEPVKVGTCALTAVCYNNMLGMCTLNTLTLTVCVCVCMYVCMCVYIYIYTHTHTYTHTHIHVHTLNLSLTIF